MQRIEDHAAGRPRFWRRPVPGPDRRDPGAVPGTAGLQASPAGDGTAGGRVVPVADRRAERAGHRGRTSACGALMAPLGPGATGWPPPLLITPATRRRR